MGFCCRGRSDKSGDEDKADLVDIQSLSQAEWTDAVGFGCSGRSDKSAGGKTKQTSWTYSQAEWTDAVGFGC